MANIAYSIKEIDENDQVIEVAYIDQNNLVSGPMASAIRKNLLDLGWPKKSPEECFLMLSHRWAERVDPQTRLPID